MPAKLPTPVQRAAISVLAVWGACATELLIVAALQRSRVASVWELQFATLYMAPSLLLAALPAACGGAWVASVIARRKPDRDRFVAVALGVCGALAAWSVTGGRLVNAPLRRIPIVVIAALLAAGGGWLLVRPMRRAYHDRPAVLCGGCLAVFIGLEMTNHWVLVRLYPGFHAALAFAALMVVPVGVGPWIRPVPGRRGWVPSLAVVVLGLAAGLTWNAAARRLAGFDNFRLLVLDHAPISAHAVRLAARSAPPPSLTTACGPGDPDCDGAPVGESPLRLRGRDIVLISVDALRADHVGAYGYARSTTPNLDRLAKQGTVFDHAYCATPHTSYSVTSMMTGKYMRPLLLQGAGTDSDTWAKLMRDYGLRTAAFYPPAVFFIDKQRFSAFEESHLGFEHYKVEFAEGDRRVGQIRAYLKDANGTGPVFLWWHLFGPHEPYEQHAAFRFGERDIDRYDSEIAAADKAIGEVVKLIRARGKDPLFIVTADHGEEFGEHGGHYHGTTVYEEQVRVPLIVSGRGVARGRRVASPVQTIDLLPTVLRGLDIPIPARVRGRDIGAQLAAGATHTRGFAFAETHDYALLARGTHRLICERRVGACQLFDLERDPEQQQPIADSTTVSELRSELRRLAASHGRYEKQGLRKEGKGWPPALLRGISGDGDAAADVAALLDDADVAVRRKAAEVLFDLRQKSTAPALRLALTREEDPDAQRFMALTLTRLGEGAPLTADVLRSEDLRWQRRAALALAESGDGRGLEQLLGWWKSAKDRDHHRSVEIINAFAKLKARDAVWPLVQSLGDVRLRPHIARALAVIGEDVARVPLVRALKKERYQTSRVALAEALVDLGAGVEMVPALVRFMGVPDPLPGALGIAERAGILERVGGPSERAMKRIQHATDIGASAALIVPRGGNGHGVRILIRVRSSTGAAGEVRIGLKKALYRYTRQGEPKELKGIPRLAAGGALHLAVPPGKTAHVIARTLPEALHAKPGKPLNIVVFADHHLIVEALAAVPLADELPPPPPTPWKPADARDP